MNRKFVIVAMLFSICILLFACSSAQKPSDLENANNQRSDMHNGYLDLVTDAIDKRAPARCRMESIGNSKNLAAETNSAFDFDSQLEEIFKKEPIANEQLAGQIADLVLTIDDENVEKQLSFISNFMCYKKRLEIVNFRELQEEYIKHSKSNVTVKLQERTYLASEETAWLVRNIVLKIEERDFKERQGKLLPAIFRSLPTYVFFSNEGRGKLLFILNERLLHLGQASESAQLSQPKVKNLFNSCTANISNKNDKQFASSVIRVLLKIWTEKDSQGRWQKKDQICPLDSDENRITERSSVQYTTSLTSYKNVISSLRSIVDEKLFQIQHAQSKQEKATAIRELNREIDARQTEIENEENTLSEIGGKIGTNVKFDVPKLKTLLNAEIGIDTSVDGRVTNRESKRTIDRNDRSNSRENISSTTQKNAEENEDINGAWKNLIEATLSQISVIEEEYSRRQTGSDRESTKVSYGSNCNGFIRAVIDNLQMKDYELAENFGSFI